MERSLNVVEERGIRKKCVEHYCGLSWFSLLPRDVRRASPLKLVPFVEQTDAHSERT